MGLHWLELSGVFPDTFLVMEVAPLELMFSPMVLHCYLDSEAVNSMETFKDLLSVLLKKLGEMKVISICCCCC